MKIFNWNLFFFSFPPSSLILKDLLSSEQKNWEIERAFFFFSLQVIGKELKKKKKKPEGERKENYIKLFSFLKKIIWIEKRERPWTYEKKDSEEERTLERELRKWERAGDKDLEEMREKLEEEGPWEMHEQKGEKEEYDQCSEMPVPRAVYPLDSLSYL